MENAEQFHVAIVGEGVAGISTALSIRQSFPNAKLIIFSDRPFLQTSSYGPAGIFRLNSNSNARHRAWAVQTFDRWAQIEREYDPAMTGVHLVSGYIQSDDQAVLEEQEITMAGIVHNFRWVTKRELDLLFQSPLRFGIHFTTYAAEGQFYVPWMRDQLMKSGNVEFEHKKLDSIQQLVDDMDQDQHFKFIVNCAGLDGGKLAGDDDTVYPCRGVGIQVSAPGHSHFSYINFDTFCLPLVGERLLIGTLRQKNCYDREVTDQDREDIWSRFLQLKPSLKDAKILGNWCGIRPNRDAGVRLEHRLVRNRADNGKAIDIIHNYGHGSNGFVLSWGCAQEVVKLIRSQQQQQ